MKRSVHDRNGAARSRAARYSDWAPVSDRPFFAGSAVADRMAALRRAIHEIRSNWSDYPNFMAELRSVLPMDGRAGSLLTSRKDWAARSSDDFSALRLYTSDAGYRHIFYAINNALRSTAPVSMRAAAFLIELLTIDLFHYRAFDAAADNFEGLIYRGMCVSDAVLAQFKRLAAAEIDDCYLSIPLALMSASIDEDRATEFALREAAADSDMHALLWRIHVAGLGTPFLDLYRLRFPSVVVTSICAVPVHRLSDYPDEQEVLLRGPFFQIMGVWSSEDLWIVDAVMMNSNRDHISAVASDEGLDREARDLFRVLVNLKRSQVCAELATEDSHLYRARAEDWQRELVKFGLM